MHTPTVAMFVVWARQRRSNSIGAAERQRTLDAKTGALASWKGLHHQPHYRVCIAESAQFVIDAYRQLRRIEKAFRMSKHDLQARPIYHRTRDSIDAHLTVVFAAMAASPWIERQTNWSRNIFVRTARRYRTVTINTG